jgi:hypothetical protein
MNKPNILRKIGNFDVQKIIDFIKENQITYDGKINQYHNRPEHFHNCNSFFFVDEFSLINIDIFNKFNAIYSEIKNLCEEVYGKGEFYKMQLSSLNKNGNIIPHYDLSLGFTFSHRIHIPIVTNKSVEFTIDGNTYFFDVGEIIEINNLKKHSVKNNGNESRIHLIFDYIGYEYSVFLKKNQSIQYF